MKAAAQVGLFVVVAVVLFLGGLFVIRGSFDVKVDSYAVVMPDAGGLAKGARVLMAGVQVGEVTEVGLDGPNQAKLKIGLKRGTQLPLSTRALLSGSLVGLGDSPLSLVQDPSYRGPRGTMSLGWTIPGGKAGPLDSILPNGGTELYTQLTETLKSVNKLLQDDRFQKDIHGLLATTQKTLETSQGTLRAFDKLASHADGVLAQNQSQLAQIVKTAEGTLSSVMETAQSIEKYAKNGKLQNGADSLLADAHQIARESQSILVDLRKTLNDPKLNGDLRRVADNLAATTDHFPAITANADKLSTNLADLTAKSQELPAKLGKVLDHATELEDRLGALVDKFGGVLGGAKGKSLPPITTELDVLRETDPGHWRTDLNATVPLRDGFVTFGLWDAFERNRVNLQLGKDVTSHFDYRYGVYAGRPAIGVDYRIAPRLSVRGDLWDLNDPRLDTRLKYDFGGGLIGWLGADRVFSDTALTVGLGVKR